MTDQTRHPQTITTREQFDATMFEVGVIYDDTDRADRICRYEYREDGWYRCMMDEYPDGDRTVPQDPSSTLPLRLVSEPTPAPVEPTDEQRAAWQALVSTMPNTAAVVAPLLPDALTNPQPALPAEPGHYEDDDGRHWLHQVYDGKGDHPDVDQPMSDDKAAAAYHPGDAPVTRPDLDAAQFREAVGAERASHAGRGYDMAHDRAHGVPHLLRWALDYASRGEAIKAGALIAAALHLSEELEREERGLRARADQAEAVTDAKVERAARAMFELDFVLEGDWTWADVVREEPSRAEIWRDDARQVLAAVLPAAPTTEQ